jgi:AcrR family transcriptional regulator
MKGWQDNQVNNSPKGRPPAVPPRLHRPLRSDTERTIRKILEVAEQILSKDPAATLERIASAAGVARTTLYRRFATREALIEAMSTQALTEVEEAIDRGRPQTAPPMVAFHEITANLIEIKSGWRFTMRYVNALEGPAGAIHDRIYEKCMRLLERAEAAGAIRPGVDLGWARDVYHSLIELAYQERAVTGRDRDALAEMVVGTLFNGIGPGGPR